MFIKTGLIAVALVAAASVTACGKSDAQAGASASASAPTAPPASVAAIARILAMPMMQRCGGDFPGHAAPTGTQVIDFGAGAFGVLADCTLAAGEPPTSALFVQGADGVLKRQSLILYNGPEYDEDNRWEGGAGWNTTWDPATKIFTVVYTMPTDDAPATNVSTMHWRWDGTKIAMIDASRVTHATPGAPATALATGYPTTPPTADPTPPAEPI